MNFVILGGQRSGSTVLASMLNTHPEIACLREVFHVQEKGLGSFFEFCKTRPDPIRFIRLDPRSSAFDGFLKHLSTETKRPHVGFCVKYGQLHQLNGDHLALGARPELFNFMTKRGGKIVNLLRRNLFRQALSHERARASGLWHIDAGEPRPATKPIILNATTVVQQRWRLLDAIKTCQEWLREVPNTFTFYYEDMFSGEQLSSEFAARVAVMLEVKPDFSLQPAISRVSESNWRADIENWHEIEQAAVAAGFGHEL